MPYAPVLTPYTDADPCPRVEVFFPEFALGTETVTVYRTARGRQVQVRGAVRAPTAGTLTRVDFEAPFDTSLTYRAEMFGGDGLSLGFTDPGVLGEIVTGPIPGPDLIPSFVPDEVVTGSGLLVRETWLHNPLNPQGAVRVSIAGSTGQELSRPVPAMTSYPLGRRVGVILAEPRRGVAGLRFDVRVSTLEDADKVQALIGDDVRQLVPVVCIRLGGDEQNLRVPQPLFLGVLDIIEVGLDVFWGGTETRQEMVGDEVDPPIPGLFIPLLTAADINVSFATAADVNEQHAAASDVNRRYDLAGAATA